MGFFIGFLAINMLVWLIISIKMINVDTDNIIRVHGTIWPYILKLFGAIFMALQSGFLAILLAASNAG
jgi:hypothetical protein